jgi:hypothetical protein
MRTPTPRGSRVSPPCSHANDPPCTSCTRKPTLFACERPSCAPKPTLFACERPSCTRKPTLFACERPSCTRKPTLFACERPSCAPKPLVLHRPLDPSVTAVTLLTGRQPQHDFFRPLKAREQGRSYTLQCSSAGRMRGRRTRQGARGAVPSLRLSRSVPSLRRHRALNAISANQPTSVRDVRRHIRAAPIHTQGAPRCRLRRPTEARPKSRSKISRATSSCPLPAAGCRPRAIDGSRAMTAGP